MLTAEHLRKQYSTVLAVDDISLSVKRGGIFGLIGPNGAGKSTTIRMLLNITSPDAGTITYDGAPFSDAVRNRIGFLPEERGLYRKNGLLDTVAYFAALRGLPAPEAKRRGMEWLERFGLTSYARRKVEELSKGNQQKVQFITAILHDPDLVVLDEPFSGLDPVNQIVMKDIFKELKAKGKAVIFSTHQMDAAEKLCDEICLINKGRIVLEGTVKQVKQRFGMNAVHLAYEGDGSFLPSLPFVEKATVYENYAELSMRAGTSAGEILPAIAPRLDVRKFEFVEPSLNSIFLNVVGETVEQAEKRETETAAATVVRTAAPGERKHQLGIVAGILIALVGGVLSFGGKDLWALTVVGIAAAGSSFVKLRQLRQRTPEVGHE